MFKARLGMLSSGFLVLLQIGLGFVSLWRSFLFGSILIIPILNALLFWWRLWILECLRGQQKVGEEFWIPRRFGLGYALNPKNVKAYKISLRLCYGILIFLLSLNSLILWSIVTR